MEQPFEWSLGHRRGSPFAKLKGDPGTVFNYSNAGVAHLVLLFHHAPGADLFPFLKPQLSRPDRHASRSAGRRSAATAAIGPYNQGYSGVHTNPREHARFCYLALHKGEWAGKRIVPASYYDFAWTGTKVKTDYGGQWWTSPGVPGSPGRPGHDPRQGYNDGFVIPSLDLVFVRLGDGQKFPKDFEKDLVLKVLAAVEK